MRTLLEEFEKYIKITHEDNKNLNLKNILTLINATNMQNDPTAIRKLNKNEDNSIEVTNSILKNLNINNINITALKFIFHELIANIYDHSEFENAIVIGRNNGESFDFIFIDDGISIPCSLTNNNYIFETDSKSVMQAINGLSTKNVIGFIERGTGLNNTINITINGAEGAVLILSRHALLHITKNNLLKKDLKDINMNGTLIGIRMKINEKIDIYNYLNKEEYN